MEIAAAVSVAAITLLKVLAVSEAIWVREVEINDLIIIFHLLKLLSSNPVEHATSWLELLEPRGLRQSILKYIVDIVNLRIIIILILITRSLLDHISQLLMARTVGLLR